MSVEQNLPVPVVGTSFNGPSLLAPDTLLGKWDADAGWHDRDGLELPSPVIALGTRRGVRRWKDHVIVDEIVDLPLPDVDVLNEAIPESEWEDGPDGKPQRPYSVWHAAYLLNPVDAVVYSYLNNTVGASIAVGRLDSSMRWMQAMRGGSVFPLVKLTDAPLRTRFGMKRRPHFEILEWRELGGASLKSQPAPRLTHGYPDGYVGDGRVSNKLQGNKVEEPSLAEDLGDDSIPF